jgi:S-layer protein
VTNGSATIVINTQGKSAGLASGNVGVTANTVSVTDVNNGEASKVGVITNVTAHNYTTATVNSNALTNLNLKNGSGNVIIGNGGLTGNTNKTLNLSLDGVTGGTLDDADVYTTINVTTKYTGTSTTATGSTLANITTTGVEALTVAGDKVLTLTSAAGLTGLKTVTVTGAAGLSASVAQASVTAVNTTGTTGTATITLDATKATYTGGAGVDNVTTSATAPTKAISLGAGDDSLTLASGTTAVTGAISGGDGTDTLSMVTADVVTASANTLLSTFVTGFERLTLTGSAGTQSVNLANIGITNFVTVAGGADVTLQNLANNGTVVISAANTGVTVTNAAFATPATDALNVVLSAAAGFNAGTFTAANVETVNLTATDTTDAATAHTLTVTANKATMLNVSGNAGVTLTLTGSVLLATLDATNATGAVTATSESTGAMTLIGGSGNDSLTAKVGATTADVLRGGAGNDTLTTNAGLTTLTGGAGQDLFVIATAGSTGSTYSTITDAAAGDRIQFANKGEETFNTTKVVLAGTASFTDYLNAAAVGVGGINGIIRYFDFGGNTFVVYDQSDSTTAFVNGTDVVVQLTGIVNLSTASLSYVGGTLPTLMIG